MKNYIGIVNLDENQDRIMELTRSRPLASVPFAGRYRIIDFILSNMANSGIANIGIFAKNKARSLIDHLNNGRPWDLYRDRDGLRVFNFSDEDNVYNDVNTFGDNLEFFKFSRQEYIILTPSYMICNIDFNEVVKYHEEHKNEITIVYKKVNNAKENFLNCESINIDKENNLISVGENIGCEKEANISMEMFVMKKDLFMDIVFECIKTGRYKKVKKCIYNSLDKLKVKAYEFKGYLACINSLNAYFKANMDLFNSRINTELFNENRPIYTKPKGECPTKYTKDCKVLNSIISNGCIIEGVVENSIICRRVHIEKGAYLNNCIILPNCIISNNAKIINVIADKHANITKGDELRGSKNFPLVIERHSRF
ncbi:glucose-1-phosphate adenylyltransferase subunit GlgD [Clostridium fallax]|uniref:Glucose-1-phosphate adenylyltransferase n=1 Tax=Clostridium fallax TaxID=1533 RepID=A0A1M4Z0S6_9CLOT|nr:glucose-1-phosphate adenylyltransferase subunit GlgD [Clostridium fallax]SHF11661.1 glucose-1-phosphate adenylyltransferase [Clostridium fallax]SQB22210.1 glycogen biosynthesis protein GlgD [Clostridium fallax]